jgi:hypothetical protein
MAMTTKTTKEKTMDKTKWEIKFNLTRDNRWRDDDDTMYDKSHIKGEIISWLEDIDYKVENVKVIEKK